MDNDLNKIELFSQSHDFKYFNILSDKAKKLMIESSIELEKNLRHSTWITTGSLF